MKIKKGDNVIVIAGSNKGKSGKVIKSIPSLNKVVVEGMNMVAKHMKPNAQNQSGGIIKKEAPINRSNVKLVEVGTKETAKKEGKKETKKTDKKETKTTKKSK